MTAILGAGYPLDVINSAIARIQTGETQSQQTTFMATLCKQPAYKVHLIAHQVC